METNVRWTEILDTAAARFGSAGFRVSLREIADEAGILPAASTTGLIPPD